MHPLSELARVSNGVLAEFEFHQPAFTKEPTFNGARRTAISTVTSHTRHFELLNKVQIRVCVRKPNVTSKWRYGIKRPVTPETLLNRHLGPTTGSQIRRDHLDNIHGIFHSPKIPTIKSSSSHVTYFHLSLVKTTSTTNKLKGMSETSIIGGLGTLDGSPN
jgi:hypothetical protein